MNMVCGIREEKEAMTYVERNNLGLLMSCNAHRIVSSYVPFIVSNKQEKNHLWSLFCIRKWENRQWISLQGFEFTAHEIYWILNPLYNNHSSRTSRISFV